jgi:hypothetical protein
VFRYNDISHCNICDEAEPNMVATYWAAGDRHYCKKCWPEYREFYENESGRKAWRRVGNYYAPTD